MGAILSLGVDVKNAVVLGESIGEIEERAPALEPPVVVVSREGFSRVREIRSFFESRGIHKQLVDVVDAVVESRLAGGVFSLEAIAESRLAKIASSRWSEARRAVDLDKAVSRRDLLRRGPLAAVELLDKPVVDAGSCSMIGRCLSCVNSCPARALSGKPPQVNYDACTACGLCYSVCPVEAISSPFVCWRSVRDYAATLRRYSKQPAHVVVVDYASLETLSGVESKHPVVVMPVESARSITPLHALILAAYGFTPHVVSRAPPRWLSSLSEAGLVFSCKSSSELAESLSREPRFSTVEVEIDPAKSRAFARLVLSAIGPEVRLDYPVVGEVQVDGDLCTLCGACARACPTKALAIEETERETRLIFDPDSCIACRECEAICPEKAVTLSTVYKRDSRRREAASSPTARCLKCGRPLGSEKMISAVERKLGLSGVGKTRHTRLCPLCKHSLLFGED